MKKIALQLLLITSCTLAFSQRQASNWYFGYGAGINFNLASNTVTPVDNGRIITNEGCSSISDEFGNLLFYTDGTVVWNKNHTQMQNGSELFGDASSTQSAIIVPKPEDPNIYYIFTVDTTTGFDPDNGFNYSVVDMTLDGGLGAVTQKNVNLLQHCTEKLTAVLKDCTSKSIWVITFASEDGTQEIYNTFHAFEINTSGVNTTAVKSTFNTLFILDHRGYLKLSPDGTKMAAAHIKSGMHVFDFNAATGTVSNPKALTINSSDSPYPYGIEFSPNSELLYVHSSNDYFDPGSILNNETPSNHTSLLTQFNLSASDIQNSQVIIDDRNLYRGGLQLGPNGKIYRALSATYNQGLPYLGVIQNPNEIGTACNYHHNGQYLGGNNSSQGLPPFITSFFNQQIDIIQNGSSSTNLDLCDGNTYTLRAPDIDDVEYTWYKDDIEQAEKSHELMVDASGLYKVIVNRSTGDCSDNLEGFAFVLFNPNPIALNHELLQCDEDGNPDGRTIFNLTQASNDLSNNNDTAIVKFYRDSNREQEVDGDLFQNTANPQIIYVEVLNSATGCSAYSQLTLEVSITDSNDTFLETCDDDGNEDGYYVFKLSDANAKVLNGLSSGLSVAYYATNEDALLENNKLEDSYQNTNQYYQKIYARVENSNNCFGISEVELFVKKLPDITTEDTYYYCLNQYPLPISIDAAVTNDNPDNYFYDWSTGEDSYSINITDPGEYQVIITNTDSGCPKTRTVTVLPSNIATIIDIPREDASENNIITVLTTGEGEYQYQLLDQDGNIYKHYQDANVFENVFPGIYSVQVRDIKNNCGITESDQFSIIGFPKFFTPNNDGYNDTWQVIGVSEMFQPNTKIQIFNRYGKLVKEITPLGNAWDGSINGVKLPSDDYWFLVKLQDGRIFRDHFTLKN